MQIITCLMIICLNSGVVLAGRWMVDNNGGKVWEPGKPFYKYVTWSGAYDENGYATGWGVLQWYWMLDGKGIRYEGEMKDGIYHGTGKIINCDSSSYDGTWYNGEKTGGLIVMANGESYSGKINNNSVAYPWLIRSPIPKEIGDFVRRYYYLDGIFGGTFKAEGYVETVNDNRIEIRITSDRDFYYGNTHIYWNALIWDDYDKWHYPADWSNLW